MARRELKPLYLDEETGMPTTKRGSMYEHDLSLFHTLETYVEEKNGSAVHELLAGGGIKLYVRNVPEKLFWEVMLKQIKHEAAKYKRHVKVDEGPMVVADGEIRWVEIVIA